jgi:A/G-specific adenine glycosylase
MDELLMPRTASAMVTRLLQWFDGQARPLPWRRTYDPYHVWLSEVMLQQTQMERGVAYFQRWLSRFPTVESVAKAELDEILKAWEGLGYYARARNLHRAAQRITEDFGGVVPSSYRVLLSLPGIGPYTAAAIASIAGNEDVAVVDANVMRVYARLFDINTPVRQGATRRRIEGLAARLLPLGQARRYNQALMDFGGLVCLPRRPRCSDCVLSGYCRAKEAGTVAERPVVTPKKTVEEVRLLAALLFRRGLILIRQRPAEVVWGGLWEFPGGEDGKGDSGENLLCLIREQTGLVPVLKRELTSVVHHYTHHRVQLKAYLCEIDDGSEVKPGERGQAYRWVAPGELRNFAFPAGPRKILEYIDSVCPEVLFAG